MTARAIILGIASAIVICCITYFNQSVMRQSALVGNYLPLSIYGTLILVVVLLNPALMSHGPGGVWLSFSAARWVT